MGKSRSILKMFHPARKQVRTRDTRKINNLTTNSAFHSHNRLENNKNLIREDFTGKELLTRQGRGSESGQGSSD